MMSLGLMISLQRHKKIFQYVIVRAGEIFKNTFKHVCVALNIMKLKWVIERVKNTFAIA